MVSDTKTRDDRSRRAMNRIAMVVSEHYGVAVTALLGRARTRKITRPRRMLVYLLTQQLPAETLEDIGKWFKRHPTTIIYLRDRVASDMLRDPAFAASIEGLKNRLAAVRIPR